MRRQASESGIALALVLWLIVALGATAVAVAGSTRGITGVVLNVRARSVARYAAESGIAAGQALLQQSLASAHSPAQLALAFSTASREFARLREVPLGNAHFGVLLTNLSGRLDLNQAEPEALEGLFSQFTSGSRARELVDALQDWKDADDLVRPQGAEKDFYLKAGSPYMPRNAPLNRVDEFGRVRGVTESIVLSVSPYITVAGDLLTDVNAASEPVLAAIPGIGPAGARAIVSRRKRGGLFTSVSEVQTLLGRQYGGSPEGAPVQRLTVAPSRLLLVSRGWMPGSPLTHEIQAAYAVVGGQLRLQSWQERGL